jgi:hypothetical protein
MKYKYVGDGAYYAGLPALDLDDADLSDDQRVLLADGVEHGLYTPVGKKAIKQEQAPADPAVQGDKQSEIDPAAKP